MNPWIRLYRESLHDPKIVTLSDRQHRAWHNCLLIANDGGELPSLRDIAAHMRVSCQDAEQLLSELVEAQLIDPDVRSDGHRTYRMHGWPKWQYVSDSSTARSRKSREKKACNGNATLQQRPCNGDATPPDFRLQTSDTEEESNSLPSEQEAPREVKVSRMVPLGGRGKGEVKVSLRRLAEGLGFPVVEMVQRSAAAKSPNAYFAELFRNEIRMRFPQAKPEFADAVIVGDTTALTAVYRMILEAT